MARGASAAFFNEAAAFSLPVPNIAVMLFGLVVVLGITVALVRSRSWRTRVPLLLMLAAGLGNLAQRVRYGGVYDPIAVGSAVFNLFDIAIGIGALWLLVVVWRSRHTVD